MFMALLTSIINVSNHTECISLNNQKCMTQPTIMNFYPNEYTQGLRYNSFDFNLDRHVGSCNSLDDLSNRVCAPNKTEDLNLSVLNMLSE